MTEICDIAIVGGGYAGTVLALHLVRVLGAGRIVIVEPRAELASGLAYSASEDIHRINVPARLMGVSDDAEDRFSHWLASRQADSIGGDPARSFVPRRWFGAFVRDRLAAALAASNVTLTHRRTEARDARMVEDGVELMLADGERLRANLVAVAVSHGVPSLPSGFPEALRDAKEFVGDPWRTDALDGIDPADDVLIVGTGLTMADIAASLLARSHRGRIVALSRHGLLSRANDIASTPASLDFASWPPAPVSAYLRKIRREIARIEQAGGSWRDVFTALREQSEALWAKLAVWEKRRFLRHLKCFYDAHRYRMAPDLAERIEEARRRGQIEIMAGRLQGARRDRGGLSVEIRPRGAAQTRRRRFGAVVNCTGPRQELRPDPTHFLGALMARGLAYPDPLGLGLTVDPDCRIFGIGRSLFALGPLTRERFGDTMGAPEIMAQAQRLAPILRNELAERCPDSFNRDSRRTARNLISKSAGSRSS